jgi:hypothetical protein
MVDGSGAISKAGVVLTQRIRLLELSIRWYLPVRGVIRHLRHWGHLWHLEYHGGRWHWAYWRHLLLLLPLLFSSRITR